jgi:hypothetical protein
MSFHRLSFYVATLVTLVATALPALYFGQREGLRAELIEQAAVHLEAVPRHFGPWHLLEESELPDSTLRMLQCENHVSRTYKNDQTGESVSLVMLVGPAGPLVAHTPEVCMTSREFEQLKAPVVVPLSKSSDDRFYAASFRAKTLDGNKLDVYYAWSRDGKHWEAPESPRLTLGPAPVLYKIQIATPQVHLAGETTRSAGEAFLSDLLPVISAATVGRETAKGS